MSRQACARTNQKAALTQSSACPLAGMPGGSSSAPRDDLRTCQRTRCTMDAGVGSRRSQSCARPTRVHLQRVAAPQLGQTRQGSQRGGNGSPSKPTSGFTTAKRPASSDRPKSRQRGKAYWRKAWLWLAPKPCEFRFWCTSSSNGPRLWPGHRPPARLPVRARPDSASAPPGRPMHPPAGPVAPAAAHLLAMAVADDGDDEIRQATQASRPCPTLARVKLMRRPRHSPAAARLRPWPTAAAR